MKKITLTLLFLLTINSVYASELVISAAASLTDAFTEMAKVYESENPTEKIHLNFASSGVLLQQILNGAPVDVFASADQLRMDKAEKAGFLIENSRHNFAGNTLVAIVPAYDKHHYSDLNAFVNGEHIARLAIANPEHVPAGQYSKKGLGKRNLWQDASQKAIFTQNVRQTLDYVARGEVDGGFVYQTDAIIMGDKVRTILSVPLDEPPTYPIAVLKNTQAQQSAQNFVNFVRSETGEKILQKYGFLSCYGSQTFPHHNR